MHIAIGYHWFPTALGFHWERALRQLGHQVTYVGLPAAERPGYDQRVPLAALLAQLQPPADLYLWIDPAGPYFPRGIEDLDIPTACYLVDVHLGHWRAAAARFFDYVFISQPGYLDHFRQACGHDRVAWLPFAAALDVHPPAALPRIYDVGFVGNLAVAHRRTARARRLRLLAERFRTNDFFRPYTPTELAEVYNQARIVFNTSTAGELTMRLFEGTGCGALVVTDAVQAGLEDLFAVGREIVVYADDADLVDKVTYYLAHEAERAAIAAAGQRRTQGEHQYQHRMRALLAALRAPQRLAPMRTASVAARQAGRHIVYTHLHMLDALFDDARAAGQPFLRRLWTVAPTLLRRLLR